jgi:hypothetical protein
MAMNAHLLNCRHVQEEQSDVVQRQCGDRPNHQNREAKHDRGTSSSGERMHETTAEAIAALLVREMCNVNRRGDDHERRGKDRAGQEGEEGRVVPVAHAVIDPLTMMVTAFYTVVALQ